MKIKPVESISTPNYPDKYSQESKQAVQSATPKRWLKVPLAVSLSAAVALGISGCREHVIMGDMPIPGYPDGGAEAGEVTTVLIPPDYVILGDVPSPIAYDTFIPLFEFGEGTGSIGCVSVAAPSFMSEEEAFAILSSAFGEAGLELIQNADTLEGSNLPIVDSQDWQNSIKGTESGDLNVHEVSGIPVKFVSKSDIEEWAGESQSHSTVQSYTMKPAAQTLADKNAFLAVFYDPITFIYDKDDDGTLEDMRYTTRDESEQLLRQQANAFVEWLQSEGLM